MSRDAWWYGHDAGQPPCEWGERDWSQDGWYCHGCHARAGARGWHERERGYSVPGWSSWDRSERSIASHNRAMTRRRSRSHSRSRNPEVDTPTRVCIKWNTTGGCRRGSRCRWLHVSYSTSEVVPSRGSVSASDGTNPLEGIIDAMRQYLASLFSIAPEVLLLLAAKDKKWQHRLAKRTYLVYIIMSFLSVRRASPPVQIRARLCAIVEGKRSAIVNHRAEPSRWPNCVSNLFGSSRAGEFQPVKTF